jgi:membrane-bound serine protease (ClpP class)
VFITIAAHVAAMAPASHIGAAHPVQMGPAPGQTPDQDQETGADQDATMEEKIVNDTVAWVRSLAELRGRNAEWAVRSVTESASVPSSEALELGVIDFVAENLAELLSLIDRRTIELEAETVTLQTDGAEIMYVDMWWGEELLSVISNPNIAFILLMLGFYGLLFEFYSPGWGISGTLGAICIVLAFFGLAVLPVNIAGLALILLAIGLFVAEVFFTSFGILTVGGAVCLILGGIMLIDSPIPVMRISLSVLIPVAVATALVAFFLLSRIISSMGTRIRTGSEGLVDETGVVSETFSPEGAEFAGQIRIHGEIWKARSVAPVEKGDRVRVVSRDNLTLYVTTQGGPTAN